MNYNLVDFFEYSNKQIKNTIVNNKIINSSMIPVIASSNLILDNSILDTLSLGYRPILFDPSAINIFSDLLANFDFDYILTENKLISNLNQLDTTAKIITINDLQALEYENKRNIIYFLTSGSTGKAKLVEKTIDNLLSEAIVLKDIFQFLNTDIVVSSVPLCHIYGFLFSYLTPSIAKSKIVCTDNLSKLITNLKENKASIWITVPSVINALIPILDENDSNSLRLIVSSGSKLSRKSAEKISDLTGAKVIEMYGSTETGGIATLDTVNSDSYTLLPSVSISISTMGNISVKSPFVSEKILSVDSEQLLLDENSYYHTNDLGYLEAEKLYLEGRNDRIVKIRGKRISLDFVEKSLANIEFIDDICVISNQEQDETDLIAFIKLNNPETTKSIKVEALKIIPDFMLPKHFIKVEEFPRLSNGKINYKLLKDKIVEIKA